VTYDFNCTSEIGFSTLFDVVVHFQGADVHFDVPFDFYRVLKKRSCCDDLKDALKQELFGAFLSSLQGVQAGTVLSRQG